MATLTVIDADRQYFLASTGLPPALAAARQTALPGAFCKHVLFDDAPLVIPDVENAPGFADYEAVELTGMRCYLGTPITTADGTRVGAMCVMGREARDVERRRSRDRAGLRLLGGGTDRGAPGPRTRRCASVGTRSTSSPGSRRDSSRSIGSGACASSIPRPQRWRAARRRKRKDARSGSCSRRSTASEIGGVVASRSSTCRGSTSASGRGWRTRDGSRCAWSSPAKGCRSTFATSPVASAPSTRWRRARRAIAS